MKYKTEFEKHNDMLNQALREQFIKAQAENKSLKIKLSRLQELYRGFDEVKEILSLTGDNPDDYIPDLLNKHSSDGEFLHE